MSPAVAALRVRGRTHIKRGIEDTLRYMGLTRKNYCAILPEGETARAMISKAKDYITWGEVDEKTVESLLRERGRIAGDKKLTDQYVQSNSKYADIKSLASAIVGGETKAKDVEGLKPIFRLNPPRKGFEREGIKKPYTLGGALGDRKEKIKDLLMRMI
ncbi:MAG: 50S ribosomal protein L30 [Candidatus Altiarchaeota archaeon]